ncbi:orotate phosphoribosyltransferase [Streptomyces shenzhenensis]|uniref:orotate phosphoribosyltransferase n=1 Tax=Streptomyces shenzhenensis TaxID=943815 RepID=UPI003408BCB2
MTSTALHDTTELARLIRDRAIVRGQVTLSSGATSDHYFDLRRVSLHPRGFTLIGHAIRHEARVWHYDAVAGLVLGAVPVALATMAAARDLGQELPAAAIRKEAKQHGLGKRIEGTDLTGKRVLLVEDTSTTGASTLDAIAAVQAERAEVVGVVLLVDRGGADPVAATGIPVRSVFTAADLLGK